MSDLEPIFTRDELSRFDGSIGPIYIAYRGIVYDVTNCPKWQSGLHQGLHFPAQDLTGEIDEAPHAEEVFRHPCAKRIGIYLSDKLI